MHYSRTSTIGKELIDLKEARDAGIISEVEYTELKKEIMEGGPVQVKIGAKDSDPVRLVLLLADAIQGWGLLCLNP